jgi:hypothetical protein
MFAGDHSDVTGGGYGEKRQFTLSAAIPNFGGFTVAS